MKALLIFILPQFAFHALSRVHQSKISQKPLVTTLWQILVTIQDTRDITKKNNKQTRDKQRQKQGMYRGITVHLRLKCSIIVLSF